MAGRPPELTADAADLVPGWAHLPSAEKRSYSALLTMARLGERVQVQPLADVLASRSPPSCR